MSNSKQIINFYDLTAKKINFNLKKTAAGRFHVNPLNIHSPHPLYAGNNHNIVNMSPNFLRQPVSVNSNIVKGLRQLSPIALEAHLGAIDNHARNQFHYNGMDASGFINQTYPGVKEYMERMKNQSIAPNPNDWIRSPERFAANEWLNEIYYNPGSAVVNWDNSTQKAQLTSGRSGGPPGGGPPGGGPPGGGPPGGGPPAGPGGGGPPGPGGGGPPGGGPPGGGPPAGPGGPGGGARRGLPAEFFPIEPPPGFLKRMYDLYKGKKTLPQISEILTPDELNVYNEIVFDINGLPTGVFDSNLKSKYLTDSNSSRPFDLSNIKNDNNGKLLINVMKKMQALVKLKEYNRKRSFKQIKQDISSQWSVGNTKSAIALATWHYFPTKTLIAGLIVYNVISGMFGKDSTVIDEKEDKEIADIMNKVSKTANKDGKKSVSSVPSPKETMSTIQEFINYVKSTPTIKDDAAYDWYVTKLKKAHKILSEMDQLTNQECSPEVANQLAAKMKEYKQQGDINFTNLKKSLKANPGTVSNKLETLISNIEDALSAYKETVNKCQAAVRAHAK